MSDYFAGGQTPEFLKYLSLVLLTLQNAALILVMRYVRTRAGDMFLATAAVVLSETLKLFTSLAIILYQVITFKMCSVSIDSKNMLLHFTVKTFWC